MNGYMNKWERTKLLLQDREIMDHTIQRSNENIFSYIKGRQNFIVSCAIFHNISMKLFWSKCHWDDELGQLFIIMLVKLIVIDMYRTIYELVNNEILQHKRNKVYVRKMSWKTYLICIFYHHTWLSCIDTIESKLTFALCSWINHITICIVNTCQIITTIECKLTFALFSWINHITIFIVTTCQIITCFSWK